MPWQEKSVMTERLRFVTRSVEGESHSSLCRVFGISRKTGYKWLERYEQGGAAGLEDKPRVGMLWSPRSELSVVSAVVALRKEHPLWGPKKLRVLLAAQHPEVEVPAASTIGDWLKAYGLLRPARRRLRVPLQAAGLGSSEAPNEVWGADFKGNFVLRTGEVCYPLTITDLASRYLLKCEGLRLTGEAQVRPEFERSFREFGLPLRIRTDNGPPFATTNLGGLSHLSVWFIKLGIIPERIEPGHPEQNGRHERMHRTLKAQACEPGRTSWEEQGRVFDLFRREYNELRPHEALGQRPPSQVYSLSLRPYPGILREPEYGSEMEVRRVQEGGKVSWQAAKIQMPSCISGEPVGFKTVGDNQWDLYYGPLWLARVEFRGKQVHVGRDPTNPKTGQVRKGGQRRTPRPPRPDNPAGKQGEIEPEPIQASPLSAERTGDPAIPDAPHG